MKIDFLTTPHSYTRTPRSFKEAHGQHLPITQRTWLDRFVQKIAGLFGK